MHACPVGENVCRSVCLQHCHSLKMAAGWSHEQTRALVSVWSQSNVQSQLDAVSRNRSVYESIARELSALGYERS